MSTFQIISDLHLESPKAYDVFEITPKAPYLALLGDIGNVALHKEECLGFLTCHLRQFQIVLFVPGNHEAYGSDWASTLQILHSFEHDIRQRRDSEDDQQLGQFVLLDRGLFELPRNGTAAPLIILGCSLFSYIPPDCEMLVEIGLQDFFQTTSWDVRAHNNAHARDLEWLNEQVRQYELQGAKIVILTHWSPTTDLRSIDPRHSSSRITSGFSTDLSSEPCFASGNVILWAFGLTHYNCDFTAERKDAAALRVLTNQRGYYFSQAAGFDVEKVVEL